MYVHNMHADVVDKIENLVMNYINKLKDCITVAIEKTITFVVT